MRLGFRHGLLAIVAVALVIRLVVVVATPDYTPRTDSADYDRIAVSLADRGSFPPSLLAPRGGPTAFRSPLFPVTLAGVYKLVGTSSTSTRWTAGLVLEALLGAAAVGLIGLIAARLWGSGVGLSAAAISAGYPPLLLVGSSLMTEPLFITLVLAAVLAALAHRQSEHAWRLAIVTGVLIGLAALTRGIGIVLLLPLGILAWTERPRLSLRALRVPAVLVAATAATLVPWTVRNADLFHAFVPISTEGGYAFAGTYNSAAAHRLDYPALWIPPVVDLAQVTASRSGLDEAQISDRLNARALHYIGDHPGYPLEVAYWAAVRLLDLAGAGFERYEGRFQAYPDGLTIASIYSFWVLSALALAGAVIGPARRAPAAFWACPAVLVIGTLFLFGSTRYRTPADPFIVMLGALALTTAWARWRARRTISRDELAPTRTPDRGDGQTARTPAP